jgi:hypothetical protein
MSDLNRSQEGFGDDWQQLRIFEGKRNSAFCKSLLWGRVQFLVSIAALSSCGGLW